MPKKQIKTIVIGVITKPSPKGELIMTHKRLVQNFAYDPLYNNTWEAVGETLKPGEDYLNALVRGIREECGVEVSHLRLASRYNHHVTHTSRGEHLHSLEPLCLIQSTGEPQLWTGPAFEVNVDPDFEPDPSKSDGEAGEHHWWTAPELDEALDVASEHFALFHIPPLRLVCQRIIERSFAAQSS